jgi:hypothetical protein
VLDRETRECVRALKIELGADVGSMVLYGPCADTEHFGDLSACPEFGKQPQDLFFGRGQVIDTGLLRESRCTLGAL